MRDVFVARQPILDTKLQVAGYELLFRNGAVNEAVVASAERATAAVVLDSFTDIGLERVVGRHPAWINVSRDFALDGLARSLPPGLVVLEVLENQRVDDRLVAELAALVHAGHRLALDDFQYDPTYEPLLEMAEIVKLDLRALGREGLAREAERCRRYGVTVLAEKVETHEEWAFCAREGCDLFQGYFFCRPELVPGRRLDANRLSILRLLGALQEPGVELEDLERMIGRDVGLSYRLLRYINSAFFGLRQEVRSIRQAVALLGTDKLKQWAALSVLLSVDGKPAELGLTALIRARFCELAGHERPGDSRGELFTLGLFSVIDALMDARIDDVLQSIPFPPDMLAALCEHAGEKGRLLDCVIALENGDFDRADGVLPEAGRLYLDAIGWANDAADAMHVVAA